MDLQGLGPKGGRLWEQELPGLCSYCLEWVRSGPLQAWEQGESQEEGTGKRALHLGRRLGFEAWIRQLL